MKRAKYLLIIFIYIFLSSSCLLGQENNKDAMGVVESYMKQQLSSDRDEYYKARDYFHPDLAIPGGEVAQFSVVKVVYLIIKVQRKMMNIDLMEPKDEEIIIVTVLFKRYCDIYNNEFIPEKKDYTRDYFLSKSTGELLILDYSDPWQETVSLEYAIQWASTMKSRSTKWFDLYTKLIALQGQQNQEDK